MRRETEWSQALSRRVRRRNAKCMRREGIRIRCKVSAARSMETYRLYVNNKKHGGDAAEKSADVRDNATRWLPAVMMKYKNVSTRKSYFISKKQRRAKKYADTWLLRSCRFNGKNSVLSSGKISSAVEISVLMRSDHFSFCCARDERKGERKKMRNTRKIFRKVLQRSRNARNGMVDFFPRFLSRR